MAYKQNDPCLKKAYDDEKIFVLMARDISAPTTILEWLKLAFYDQPDDKLREAFEAAIEMKNRRPDIINRIAYEKQLAEQQVPLPISSDKKTPALPKIYCRCPEPEPYASGMCGNCGGLIPTK